MSKILFDALKTLRELHRDNPGTVQIIEDAMRENRADGGESTVKVRKVCSKCGSDRLSFTGNLVWDEETQNYEIADVWNDVFCRDCEGDTREKEVEVEN